MPQQATPFDTSRKLSRTPPGSTLDSVDPFSAFASLARTPPESSKNFDPLQEVFSAPTPEYLSEQDEDTAEEDISFDMAMNRNDVQQLLRDALAPLQQANTDLRSEITSLRSQLGNQSSDPAQSPAQIKAAILKEERIAADRRVCERLEQQNIAISDDESFDSRPFKEKIKTSDLDEFDGTDVHGFAMSVESAKALFPTDSVASTMSRNLRGMAKIWFQNLDTKFREALLLDSDNFMKALRSEFEVDKGIARQIARERKWTPFKESVMTYFYDKIKLVTNSYGSSMDQADQCHEVREGLPDDFKPFIQTQLGHKPALDHLRRELKLLEPDYLANKRKRLQPSPLQLPMQNNQASNQAPPRQIKQEANQGEWRGKRPTLKDSFNPKMIGQSPNPANPNQMVRTYKVPDGSGRVLMLNRPCRTCGGNHFDFEPVHLQTSPSSNYGSESPDESYATYFSKPKAGTQY